MNLRPKFFVYKYHVWFVLLAVLAAILVPIFFRDFVKDWRVFVPIIGGLFAFALSVEKHRLDENGLFRELFAEFNKRYEALSTKLNRIREGDPEVALNREETDALYLYFNLCAEEFLYYRQGYIYPEVWKAWRNGMNIFAKSTRIRKLWVEELKTDSYYGFALPEISE